MFFVIYFIFTTKLSIFSLLFELLFTLLLTTTINDKTNLKIMFPLCYLNKATI